ncbi:TlpA family protein disulfide reductase [Nonomuraea cavernae]|uniref:Thioredoxin domain-containing protein n=1 Tax=Nonomuraea cavernae TaxID=2045107 RepID=A0A917Z8T3_9ACTN|nr:hypothetical protein [Nonomuraea cavernae]MCA2189914.1 hypothetical protein [Nonomuraea cavernae]GGO77871.1 hypothetical protein GCM10012289_58550 [Nonomuraea cavernae]
MPFLVAGMVVFGLLCLVNLVLTLAVIRRLREHTEQLVALKAGDPAEVLLATGTSLPVFEAESVDGETIDSRVTSPEVVALLSTECSVCLDQLPDLVGLITDRRVDRPAAVAVIMGDDSAQAEQLVEKLRPVASVVRQPWGGPIEKAFQARAFPAFYLASEGVVRAASISVMELDRPVPA